SPNMDAGLNRQPSGLFDRLVGAKEQRGRNCDAGRLCRPLIYQQLELRGRVNWHLARLLPVQDAVDVPNETTVDAREGGAISHESPNFEVLAEIAGSRAISAKLTMSRP